MGNMMKDLETQWGFQRVVSGRPGFGQIFSAGSYDDSKQCRKLTWVVKEGHKSMGDLQDPTDGGTLVPYVWPYELWGYPLT